MDFILLEIAVPHRDPQVCVHMRAWLDRGFRHVLFFSSRTGGPWAQLGCGRACPRGRDLGACIVHFRIIGPRA